MLVSGMTKNQILSYDSLNSVLGATHLFTSSKEQDRQWKGGNIESCKAPQYVGGPATQHAFKPSSEVHLDKIHQGAFPGCFICKEVHTPRGHCRSGLTEADVLDAIERRASARKDKDFAAADAVREEIAAKGIQILDTPEGTTWRPNPNLEIAGQ
jgi:cysteinyl-tRNA synthetase